ncbi:MAG: YlbF family regulator [Clostridia bacterium]|nr:YlbF family regulator [Clostridia bacterium]
MSTLNERLEALGEAIMADPRRAAWIEARDAQAADEALQGKIAEFNEVRNELMEANMQGPVDEDRAKGLSEKMNAVYTEIMGNPNMIKFMEAQEELSAMIQGINNRIQFFVTGEEPTACDGNCASCSSNCGA